MKGILAFAVYKPKEGKTDELLPILDRHIEILRQKDYITEKDDYLVRASNGYLVEIFAWKSQESIDAVHKDPDILQIWNEMMALGEFGCMEDLPESEKIFPNFDILK
ncbi:MAG: hypothetical protein KDC73_10660 [Ignavibacteriae bacterium]|nr:hypothetical protein [Ignavibacteriota bacterium]MCB9242525.1 hypothetical protein [Ignavibacteriales bacterium]